MQEVLLKDVPKKQFGDLSFNCGVLSSETKKNPILIATELSVVLQKQKCIDEVQSA
jgi:arginyl-tRNA synthetase